MQVIRAEFCQSTLLSKSEREKQHGRRKERGGDSKG